MQAELFDPPSECGVACAEGVCEVGVVCRGVGALDAPLPDLTRSHDDQLQACRGNLHDDRTSLEHERVPGRSPSAVGQQNGRVCRCDIGQKPTTLWSRLALGPLWLCGGSNKDGPGV